MPGDLKKLEIEVYKRLVQQLISDNQRIWFTGSILIPLAFSAFGVFCTVRNPCTCHSIVLGVASSLLLCFWNLVADRHREFQGRSLFRIQAFESKWEIPTKITEAIPDKEKTTEKQLAGRIQLWLFRKKLIPIPEQFLTPSPTLGPCPPFNTVMDSNYNFDWAWMLRVFVCIH